MKLLKIPGVVFPRNARIRVLIDGSLVPEIRKGSWPFYTWKGCDTITLGCTRYPGSIYYRSCICTDPSLALKVLAANGI